MVHDPQYRDPRIGDIDQLLEGSEPDEAGWYDGVRRYLETAYLAGENRRAQSGFGGDEEYWERARRPMTRAIERDGSFLDVGCANGLLMESVVHWTAENGYHIEPYGLDFSPSIADLARRRLPHWQDRIYTGNVIDWQPPFRFNYVGVGLDSVPPARQQQLVERLLRECVLPNGRLILRSYGSASRPAPRALPVGDLVRGWGFSVAGEVEGIAPNGVVVARFCWVIRQPDGDGDV